MKKWDAKRSIEREQIYKLLSPQNKEDMLGQIAFNTFVNAEYFFRQEDLQSQIKDYICNLPEASADPNALQLDSEVVLKAIEHHHGLLVERARNIYSFSHLTFQEYFTARGIERERQLKILVKFITDPRWKEIFLLTSEMLRQSDDFLQLIKEKIDKMLLGDEALQAFLCWAKQKADSVQTKYKTFAVRAYYAYVGFYDSKRTLDCALDLARIIDIDLDRDLDLDRALALERDQALETALERSIDLVHDRSLDCDLAIAIGIDINRSLNRVIDRSFDLNRSLDIGNDILLQVLQILKEKLPNPKDNNYEAFSKWWWTNGEEWSRELHQVWTDRRYISHNWQFTDEQVELLKQYYAANLLLVECMNRSYVSKQVREAIESTMLLPRKK
jgi:predicted NACHT family NTPase